MRYICYICCRGFGKYKATVHSLRELRLDLENVLIRSCSRDCRSLRVSGDIGSGKQDLVHTRSHAAILSAPPLRQPAALLPTHQMHPRVERVGRMMGREERLHPTPAPKAEGGWGATWPLVNRTPRGPGGPAPCCRSSVSWGTRDSRGHFKMYVAPATAATRQKACASSAPPYKGSIRAPVPAPYLRILESSLACTARPSWHSTRPCYSETHRHTNTRTHTHMHIHTHIHAHREGGRRWEAEGGR